MTRLLLPVLLALSLVACAPAQPLSQVLENHHFTTLDGQKKTLSQLRRESPTGVVMLTFWCTMCKSCRASEKDLAAIAESHKDKALVTGVVASRYDNPDKVRAYLDKSGISLRLLLDDQSQLARDLKVDHTTTTLVLDAEGKLRYFGTLRKGDQEYAQKALDDVLQGRPVAQPLGPIYG